MPQDPEQIQREIEEIRSELAGTVEELAGRVSPKAAAKRGGDKVRAWVDETLGRSSPDDDPAAAQLSTMERVRWDRVAAVAGVLGTLVLLRRRKKRKRAGS